MHELSAAAGAYGVLVSAFGGRRVRFRRRRLLRVAPGMEHAVSPAPRTRHLVRSTSEPGDEPTGTPACGAHRPLVALCRRTHRAASASRTAISNPSPTGVIVLVSRSSVTSR